MRCSSSGMDPIYVKGLREAKALVDAGTITPEEFEKEKKKLLSQREEREKEAQAQDEQRRKRSLEEDGAGGDSSNKSRMMMTGMRSPMHHEEWLKG
jgi:hypothetical protein